MSDAFGAAKAVLRRTDLELSPLKLIATENFGPWLLTLPLMGSKTIAELKSFLILIDMGCENFMNPHTLVATQDKIIAVFWTSL